MLSKHLKIEEGSAQAARQAEGGTMNSEHNAIGRHGVPGTQRLYGKCRDCGRMEKLSGWLCKYCYNARYRGYRYRTDPEYRRAELARVEKYRKVQKSR